MSPPSPRIPNFELAFFFPQCVYSEVMGSLILRRPNSVRTADLFRSLPRVLSPPSFPPFPPPQPLMDEVRFSLCLSICYRAPPRIQERICTSRCVLVYSVLLPFPRPHPFFPTQQPSPSAFRRFSSFLSFLLLWGQFGFSGFWFYGILRVLLHSLKLSTSSSSSLK